MKSVSRPVLGDCFAAYDYGDRIDVGKYEPCNGKQIRNLKD